MRKIFLNFIPSLFFITFSAHAVTIEQNFEKSNPFTSILSSITSDNFRGKEHETNYHQIFDGHGQGLVNFNVSLYPKYPGSKSPLYTISTGFDIPEENTLKVNIKNFIVLDKKNNNSNFASLWDIDIINDGPNGRNTYKWQCFERIFYKNDNINERTVIYCNPENSYNG